MKGESIHRMLRYQNDSISVLYGVDTFLKQCWMNLPMRMGKWSLTIPPMQNCYVSWIIFMDV